jgi:hypothetical protein
MAALVAPLGVVAVPAAFAMMAVVESVILATTLLIKIGRRLH